MDSTGLGVVRQGMRVVGVPTVFLQEVLHGKSAELARATVAMEDAGASVHILHLSAVSRLSHILHTVPLPGYNALVEWAC